MSIAPFDATGLGSRLRRLSQLMLADVDRAYAAEGLAFRTRLFPIVFALHRDGPLSISELTALSGFTQPAVSQTVRRLEKDGHVRISAGRDARNRNVSLTPAGQALVRTLQPFWDRARRAAEALLAEATPDFMASLQSLEEALERRPLSARIAAMAPAATPDGAVDILPFDVAFKKQFHDLNREWVETFFYLEKYDIEQLENPERILEAGGEIWFARLDGRIVGTGALYCHGDGEYEVAKMAVMPGLRGRGVGRKVMEQLIRRFRERGGKRLVLATNSKLEPAIRLYRSVGFVDYVPEKPPEYARANVFMEWTGNDTTTE
ncbi:MAG: bifunctional helix-turn-helix transcriptional regulator/GNAT family N-acetyltransferase [Proteobacteria bacterium]|nr:bifunctional helix-turn-helix transcriptional regulator/GNAT family N-acetyltransferase [Pseudomonadota bacterium]